MQKQTFKTEDLRTFLEQTLGFELASIERIGGGGSLNFKAVRQSDGLIFQVKCFPLNRRAECEKLAAILRVLEGAKVPKLLFADKILASFSGHVIICLSWELGEFLHASQLTGEQWALLLEDYKAFSDRMQSVSSVAEAYPLRAWWRAAYDMPGLGRRILRPLLADMQKRDLDQRPSLLRTIHGDFHRGNLLFRAGELVCFMDHESLRQGYGPEDIACYCLAEAPESYRTDRRRFERILVFFQEAVTRLPYSRHEWRMTLDIFFLMKLRRRTGNFSRIGIFTAWKMKIQAKIDEIFRQQLETTVI